MKTLEMNELERIEGGGNGKIPWEVCLAATVISFAGLIGALIGGPTAVGCLLKGESIL